MSDQQQTQLRINTMQLDRSISVRTLDDSVRVVIPEVERKKKLRQAAPTGAVVIPMFVEVPPQPPTMVKPVGLKGSSHNKSGCYGPTVEGRPSSPEAPQRTNSSPSIQPHEMYTLPTSLSRSVSDADALEVAGRVFGFPNERSTPMPPPRDPLDMAVKQRPLRGTGKHQYVGRRRHRGSLKMSSKYDSLGESDHAHDYGLRYNSISLDDFEVKMNASDSNLELLQEDKKQREVNVEKDLDRRKALLKAGHLRRPTKQFDCDPSCLQLSASGKVVTMKIQNPVLFKTTSNCA